MAKQIEIRMFNNSGVQVSTHIYRVSGERAFVLNPDYNAERVNPMHTECRYKTEIRYIEFVQGTSQLSGEAVPAHSYPLPGETIKCFVDGEEKAVMHAQTGISGSDFLIDLW